MLLFTGDMMITGEVETLCWLLLCLIESRGRGRGFLKSKKEAVATFEWSGFHGSRVSREQGTSLICHKGVPQAVSKAEHDSSAVLAINIKTWDNRGASISRAVTFQPSNYEHRSFHLSTYLRCLDMLR